MKIALNLVFLVPGEVGGMEIYARELIPRLAAAPDLDIVCLVNREAAAAGDGPWGEICPMEVVPVHARSRVEWVRGEQQHVPRMAQRMGADLVHSLASTAPLWGAVPRITTIHDLNYLLVPEAHFGARGLGMRVLVPASARRSRRIIVDAEATRRDLVRHLRVDADKVDVVPLAADVEHAPLATPPDTLRARLRLGQRTVILSPGAKRPHKNLGAVLRALARLEPESRPVLVVTGYATPYESELRAQAAALGLADEVLFPSWLDAADLEGLYGLAAAMVLPSRYEGFGLPIVEAMGRGVPVVTSDRSSMPEVAGNAALLVNPDDDDAIAEALRRVLHDGDLRMRLSAAGRAQAATFTWARTADLTAASYQRALRPNGSR